MYVDIISMLKLKSKVKYGFWSKQVDVITDIRITYPEANSSRNSTVEKILEKQEKEKKEKNSTALPR